MNPGELRHRIVIEVRKDNKYVEFIKAWSKIRPLNAEEKINRPDIEQSVSHVIEIRYRKGITSIMRVRFRDRCFGIESVLDPDERKKSLNLMCEELLPLVDVIKVLRKAPVKNERNIVNMDNSITHHIQACITGIEDSFKRYENEPIEWGRKAEIICDLSEDIKTGDTLTLLGEGDFFVVEAIQGKHFLEITAHQDKRGAE
ncbi:phage head closure protein [Brevibacillus sp. VP]|uniref:phage head closure protein n=1 Tax=unclassified Brevibacillus TaxID=2684853 RepID=UPI000E2EB7AA|nr:phage head closure protein [Brevibacillus sp. VP]RFB28249.1 hypothetical protein DZB91_24200 [Brevibacillus sp. VP]